MIVEFETEGGWQLLAERVRNGNHESIVEAVSILEETWRESARRSGFMGADLEDIVAQSRLKFLRWKLGSISADASAARVQARRVIKDTIAQYLKEKPKNSSLLLDESQLQNEETGPSYETDECEPISVLRRTLTSKECRVLDAWLEVVVEAETNRRSSEAIAKALGMKVETVRTRMARIIKKAERMV